MEIEEKYLCKQCGRELVRKGIFRRLFCWSCEKPQERCFCEPVKKERDKK